MPVALIVAVIASLGIHVAALFGTGFDLEIEPEATALFAELRPTPMSLAIDEPAVKKVSPQRPKKISKRKEKTVHLSPVVGIPGVLPTVTSDHSSEPIVDASVSESAVSEPRLPSHGVIRYRVDRGDSGFEIGKAQHEWIISDGRYQLFSTIETTGVVWLFKSYFMEMESRGLLTVDGLRPDYFVIRRNRVETKEKAFFDWQTMKVLVGQSGEHVLAPGSQDLLSFNYQLGYLPHPEAGGSLPIATGKKYGVYHLESLGDEELEVPAGTMRTLHLRAPGENTTEIWLAYDYLMLPVKIRHVDKQGDSLVEVATEISVGTR